MLTLDEIGEKMQARWDPDFVVEILELTTEDLVNAFSHRIADMYERLNEEFEDDN
jgi:hypothetical protein